MSQIQVADPLTGQIRGPHDIQMQRKWAIATAIAVLVSVLAWLGLEIPRGTLTHTDELLTAERSREMLSTEPWVVHYNFQRSFEKPPLQFWLTSLTLSQLHNRTLAVRVWPLLYGCLTMVALGWLVFLVEPNRPWLIPLSLAVLASSPLFSPEASRGFLDIGLTFFTISAILFAQLARNRPAWWLGVAAASWLGSLQKTRDKKQALEICRAWHKAALQARNGKLSVDAAREVIAQGVSDVFTAANVESLPSASIKSWCETWLQAKSIEAEESTHARYARIIERFIECIGAKANRDLSTLQPVDITRFRDREAKALSRATANLSLKVLRVCFGEAVRQGLLAVNPAVRVPVLKTRDKSARRAFTLSEITRILKACGDDVEWRGLVLFGLYLGQRLGDLAKLTWRAINFETGEIAFIARKTGRRIVLPLVQPLIDYLTAPPASDNPNAYIFPRAASAKRTSTLSNQFREILVAAALVEPRGHESTGKGRSQARETSEISFHSLRHSAVTMLKASGLSDVFAREIVGHESSAVSRQYTHLSTEDLRTAMQRLPDVTNAEGRAQTLPQVKARAHTNG